MIYEHFIKYVIMQRIINEDVITNMGKDGFNLFWNSKDIILTPSLNSTFKSRFSPPSLIAIFEVITKEV